MSPLPRKQTLWRLGLINFEHPPLEDYIGPGDGLFPMQATLDPDVGEEVVLYLRDQTPFMDELRRLRPFRLMLYVGIGRNEFGPLCFLVFWVPIPDQPDKAFSAYEQYLNPHSEIRVALWRELAAQTHWHLFLIGEGGHQREFFEFENNFNLDDSLDFVNEACGPIQLVDFDRAKAKFMRDHSVDDLLRMGNKGPG